MKRANQPRAVAAPLAAPASGSALPWWTKIVALVAYGLLLAASAPPWPDDWDGLGFVASETRFDMAAFAPHPPGYPVYVVLLRFAHSFVKDGVGAANAVAVASGLATVSLAWSAAGRALTKSARLPVAVAVAVTPLAWRAESAVGSEAPALALAALGVWALVVLADGPAAFVPTARPLRPDDVSPAIAKDAAVATVLGAAIGLGLGVRLSWAPLYLPMLLLAPRRSRLHALSGLVVATVAWALPLTLAVGPARLVALFRTHFAGHAERWGGTALTDPGLARVSYLARDLFVDGLGAGRDLLGITIGLVTAFMAATGIAAWRREKWAGLRAAAVVLVPYLAWIAIGQNLKQQPRHALPLVVALSIGLALAARAAGKGTGVALALVLALRTGSDAYARRTTAPPGQQLVDFMRALPDPRGAALFGETSVRFFAPTELADRARVAGTVGDVRVGLGRMAGLPNRIFVTSEIAGRDDARPPLTEVTTVCRPARLDRRAPCITLYEWSPFAHR